MNYKASFSTINNLLLIVFLFISCTNSLKDNEKQQPYLILLSMDGFRWDYPEKAYTPTLDSIEQYGVRANLIPSFPTKTFPNHYSMATGLYPENHGLLLNNFHNYELGETYSIHARQAIENADFYKGEPIWVTAEKQDVTTASYFWVGSEAPIQGIQPTYWKKYDHYLPFNSIIDTVIYWLDLPYAKKPHLITFYFNEPDEIGHKYGPESTEIVDKVEYLDSLLDVFFDKINKLPNADKLNIIITSDHGMAEVPSSNMLYLYNYISSEWVQHSYGGSPVYLVKANEGYIDSIYLH